MKQKKWNWVVIFLAFVLAFTTVSPAEQIWADSSVEQESDITEPETEVPTDTQPNEEESAMERRNQMTKMERRNRRKSQS